MEHLVNYNGEILIIDNLSFFNNENNELENNELENIYNTKNLEKKIYIISNSINKKFTNLIINPEKIYEVDVFFKKNKIPFGIIIDINSSDYILQLSCFSIWYYKTTDKYLIKMNDKYKKIIIYNVRKFTKNITIENNYLIATK